MAFIENEMRKIEYDYFTEKEVLDEAKVYCALRGTSHIYNALIISRKSKNDSMPYAVLKSLYFEEVHTTVKIIKPGEKDKYHKKVEWRRVKNV